MSANPPAQDQQNFVWTNKFFIFFFKELHFNFHVQEDVR
jgi:hypothetical protein